MICATGRKRQPPSLLYDGCDCDGLRSQLCGGVCGETPGVSSSWWDGDDAVSGQCQEREFHHIPGECRKRGSAVEEEGRGGSHL